MTDERLYELMGWDKGMEIAFGSLAYRVRALVATAERDERDKLLRGEFICAKCGLRKDAEID